MSAQHVTILGRRERLWPAVTLSAVAHALLVAVAVAKRPPPPIDLDQKPIVAKLVRIGEKRPEAWLPRKEAPPPPPAPPAPTPAPAVATAPAAPTRPAATPPAPSKPSPPSASARGEAGGTTLSDVLSRVRREVAEERWGDPEGDAAGDAASASEGDRYQALVTRELRSHYRVPATISEQERLYLQGTIVLFIEPDGRIRGWRFETRSGNAAFDEALERTLRQTRLPPPPSPMRELYRSTGLRVVFKI